MWQFLFLSCIRQTRFSHCILLIYWNFFQVIVWTYSANYTSKVWFCDWPTSYAFPKNTDIRSAYTTYPKQNLEQIPYLKTSNYNSKDGWIINTRKMQCAEIYYIIWLRKVFIVGYSYSQSKGTIQRHYFWENHVVMTKGMHVNHMVKPTAFHLMTVTMSRILCPLDFFQINTFLDHFP